MASKSSSVNNASHLGYGEAEKRALMADFIEILAHGYTVDRAQRLLKHWAVSEDHHVTIKNERVDEPHPSFGRAVPSRKTFYFWKDEPEMVEFKEAWNEAIDVRGTEYLEDHAHDLAYAGDSKMVMFLLKARNPQKYANFGALGGGSFNIQITAGDVDL
jgi:hypothetical protein